MTRKKRNDGQKQKALTVAAGDMAKDLAFLIGPNQKWLTTTQFLDKIDSNLKAALATA